MKTQTRINCYVAKFILNSNKYFAYAMIIILQLNIQTYAIFKAFVFYITSWRIYLKKKH